MQERLWWRKLIKGGMLGITATVAIFFLLCGCTVGPSVHPRRDNTDTAISLTRPNGSIVAVPLSGALHSQEAEHIAREIQALDVAIASRKASAKSASEEAILAVAVELRNDAVQKLDLALRVARKTSAGQLDPGSLEKAKRASSSSKQVLSGTFPEFPWPPPQASTSVIIPIELLKKSADKVTYLGDIDELLGNALESSGYIEKRYFAIIEKGRKEHERILRGFALVTRLEQINPDGTPKDSFNRWSTKVEPLRKFSLTEYLNALFTARPGFYRIIVFAVTPDPFSQSERKVDRDEAMDWLREGLNKLPVSIATDEYTNEYTTTALIYEFDQPESQGPVLNVPSRLPANVHLERSGFLSALER